MLKIVDYMESFFAIAAVFVALMLAAIVTMTIEVKKGYFKEYIITAVSIMIAGICMVIQMIIYLKGGKAFDVTIAAVGLFVMLILATIDTVNDIYDTYADRDRAKYENEAKSQFLANMSHEIRTPINAIIGMNSMVLKKSQDEEILGFANDIKRASNTLLTIVNDILDFSKIESGKMELAIANYNLRDVLKEVVTMIQPKAEEKELAFELDIDENLPCGLTGDDVRIKQILMNLLTNAVKYTPKGKVIFSVRKNEASDDSSLKDNQISLHFSVKDTGKGIKETDIAKLTEKFVRIDEIKNRNIEGTGLGINIVVSLLNLMDSELHVKSVYGEGSNFYFDLVQEVTNDEYIGNVDQILNDKKVDVKEEKEKLHIPDARFLVVDDNHLNRRVFCFSAQQYECKVEEADSGAKCLELVKENKYDIIFMDHMMPEMDGIETLQHMKEFGEYLNADTPVIILTANAINGAEEEYMSAGFDGYLSKPMEPERFEEIVRKFLKK